MRDDSRYEAAFATASSIIHELTTRPHMSRPEKLSTVTFIVLHAMHEVEDEEDDLYYGVPTLPLVADGTATDGLFRRIARQLADCLSG